MPVKFEFQNIFLKTWLLIHQTYSSIVKCEDKVFSEYGITTEQHSVLMTLKYIQGPATITEIAKWLDRNPNSISVIVERMVKAGLLFRKKVPSDRRVVHLLISEKGKRICDNATIAGWTLVKDMLLLLSEEELQTMAMSLQKVRDKAIKYINPEKKVEKITTNESRYMIDFEERVKLAKHPVSDKTTNE